VVLSSNPPLAGAGYRRILQGQTLHLHSISNAAVALRAWARVIYDNGQGQLLTIPEVPRSGSRVAEDLLSTDVVIRDGWVVNAEVQMVTASIKRGQTYVRLAVEPFGTSLLSDYCFSEFGNVSLGTFIQPGPGGGDGNLEIVTVKDDSAPVGTTTVALAATNTIRKVYGFAWYYNASADVATRTLNSILRNHLGTVPTGFTGIFANTWLGVVPSLTASQEGYVFGDPKRTGSNDNGTLAIDDAASAPSPFPILVLEGDPVGLILLVLSGQPDDRDSIYLFREEWVVL